MVKSELYQTRVDEYENMEVASLMLAVSKKLGMDSWTAELLMKAAKLLCETTFCCCDILNELKSKEVELGSERLLKAIFERKDDDNDPNHETD